MPIDDSLVQKFKERWEKRYDVEFSLVEARNAAEGFVAFVRWLVTGKFIPPPSADERSLSDRSHDGREKKLPVVKK